jgi:flagellar biosynthesis/type III secretory pathway M-ring protein FliF/YscJ
MIAGLVEPSPQGWADTGERLVRLADTHREAFWPVVAVLIALASPLLIAGIVWKVLIPAWREEKKLDREQEARDRAAERELEKANNDALIAQLGGKLDRMVAELDRVSARIERQGEALARLEPRP